MVKIVVNNRKGKDMEIIRMKNDSIINIGYEAMKKTPERRTDALNHITVCLAKIIAIGEEKGCRLSLRYSEFFDFIDDIIQRVKKKDCILIISIPANPPVGMLDRVRTLCDNSLDSITITAKEQNSSTDLPTLKTLRDSRTKEPCGISWSATGPSLFRDLRSA